MIHNLNELGICVWLHSWMHSFLTKRTLWQEHSKCIDVMSGAPQVSVLGPVLFLLYINNDVKNGGQFRVHLMFKVCKMTLTICQACPRGLS